MTKAKLMLNIILMLLTTLNVLAQVSAGVHLGGSLASIKEIPYDGVYPENQVRLNTVVGITMHSPLYSQNNLQISTNCEINYETKGISNEVTMGTENGTLTGDDLLTLHYLTLPAYLRSSIDMGDIELFFDAGAYIASLLAANSKTTGDLGDEIGSNKKQLDLGNGSRDDLKHFDAGLIAAAGINYQDFNLSLRYAIGLFNINSAEEESRWHNRSLQMLLAYDF